MNPSASRWFDPSPPERDRNTHDRSEYGSLRPWPWTLTGPDETPKVSCTLEHRGSCPEPLGGRPGTQPGPLVCPVGTVSRPQAVGPDPRPGQRSPEVEEKMFYMVPRRCGMGGVSGRRYSLPGAVVGRTGTHVSLGPLLPLSPVLSTVLLRRQSRRGRERP